ncbi:MAG TPA: hypothetical protein ACFYEH_07700 [Candidatus Brocadiaceae bacterium]
MRRETNAYWPPVLIDKIEIKMINATVFTGNIAMTRIGVVLRRLTSKRIGPLSCFHNQIYSNERCIFGKVVLGNLILLLITTWSYYGNAVFLSIFLCIDVKLRGKGLKP